MSASGQPDQDEEEILPFSALTFEEVIAAGMLLMIVLSVSWGVVTRYLLASPADWAPEAASIAFAWVVFIAAAAIFTRGEHSSVDALLHKFPPPIAAMLQIVADVIVLATLLVVSWLAIGFAISTMDVPTTVLRVPQGITYSAAAIGFVLMAVRHALFVIRRLRGQGGR